GAASHGVGVQTGGDGAGRDTARAPPGRGAPRGEGSNRQRRQRKGRGRAPHPGAASRGVGVQVGGDGGAGPGRRSPSRPARPTGGRVLYAGFNGGGAGSARLAVAADDVYQRVAPP